MKSINIMIDIFDNFYKGKRVLITGHTGFKGSWLSIWLNELGAEVIGVAKDPFSDRDNFVLSRIGKKIKADLRADIRDGEKMKKIFCEYKPDIVFHLAAQPLVRLSYDIPVETYETNVMGTINIMEAIRVTQSVKVAVMITTDKCYETKSRFGGIGKTSQWVDMIRILLLKDVVSLQYLLGDVVFLILKIIFSMVRVLRVSGQVM